MEFPRDLSWDRSCLLYNDIDEQIVSKILKFADDTKIYHIVQSPKDIETLQSDLHTLVAWSNDWQMLFNTDKCKVLHFGFNNPHIDYSMDGVKLQLVKEEKDLGVTVSECLYEVGEAMH